MQAETILLRLGLLVVVAHEMRVPRPRIIPSTSGETLTTPKVAPEPRNSSATTVVSVRNTRLFRSALTFLTEPHPLPWRNTCFPSPRQRIGLHTCLLYYVAGYAPSERHVYYTLCRGCSYVVAVYTTPVDVYAFFLLSATFYVSAIAIYRMLHSPHICLALRCCHLLQYSLRFG